MARLVVGDELRGCRSLVDGGLVVEPGPQQRWRSDAAGNCVPGCGSSCRSGTGRRHGRQAPDRGNASGLGRRIRRHMRRHGHHRAIGDVDARDLARTSAVPSRRRQLFLDRRCRAGARGREPDREQGGKRRTTVWRAPKRAVSTVPMLLPSGSRHHKTDGWRRYRDLESTLAPDVVGRVGCPRRVPELEQGKGPVLCDSPFGVLVPAPHLRPLHAMPRFPLSMRSL